FTTRQTTRRSQSLATSIRNRRRSGSGNTLATCRRQSGAATKRSARKADGEQASRLRGPRASAATLHPVADSRLQARRRLRAFSNELHLVWLAHGSFDESSGLRFAGGLAGVCFRKLC